MKKIFQKIVVFVIVSILLSFNVVMAVSQSDINAQKSQQQENKNEINKIQSQKKEVQAEKSEIQAEVNKLNSQIDEYQGQITSIENQITEANKKITEAENNLKKATEDYKNQQETLQNRMVAMYESGDTSYLDVLLSSTSITDFISNYYLVSEVTQYDSELLVNIQKQKEQIEASKVELENGKKELTESKASKESVSKQLKSAKASKDAKVSQLSEEEKKLQAEIEELQKDNAEINKKIQAMQAQIAAQAKKMSSNSGSNNQASNSSRSAAGFIKPVNSYITVGMYYPSGGYHGAVDYGASGVNGMPVYAVADGIVVTTKALTTSYGNYIILYHPSSNLYTLYAHGQAGSICVSELQTVKQGQKIMNVGSTGHSTGPHLHFEVRTSPGYYSNRVDPRSYLPQ